MSNASGHGFEAYLLEVANGRPGVGPSLLRGGLAALAPVYCVGLKAYLLPYELGLRQRARLSVPVICVGNLTTGGTGKTPTTQTLCRLLQQRNPGLRPVVLNRGYGGSNEYGCAIVSDGENVLLSAQEAGDEAALLAKTLPGVPVIVGKDRRKTGALAVERFRPDLIVLDDGLQFWQLHRDLNIVLLNAVRPFDNGWTFPRGLLREPPSHLRRAGIVVLTNARRAPPETLEDLKRTVNRLAPGRPVFTAELAPTGLTDGDGRTSAPETLRGRKVAALSALGNPASFEATLESLGANIVARTRFPDHYAPTANEWQDALRPARNAGAEWAVTTEKDAVKRPPLDGALPVFSLAVRMAFDDEPAFLTAVLERIERPKIP